MKNENPIIKATRNNQGKVIIRLFNQDIDVTKKVKDGVAVCCLYGTTYRVIVAEPKKTVAKSKKKPAKKIKVQGKSETYEPEIKFIETKIK